MPNAAYFRAQAKLCRELARQLSSPKDAEQAVASADRYLVQARRLEENPEDPNQKRDPSGKKY